MDLKTIFAQPIAHRGLHNRANGIIENSATAFGRAIKGGYAIECDLQLSGDGVPVVFHDSGLERLTGQSGRLSTLSAGQIGRVALLDSKNKDAPQTFAALLEQIDGSVPLIVELKMQEDGRNAELADASWAAARDYQGPLVFKSFVPELLKLTRRAGYPGPLGIVTYDFRDENSQRGLTPGQRFYLRHLLHVTRFRFDFISCDRDSLTLPAVRLMRHFKVPVMAWTVRSYDDETTARRHADQIVFEGFLPQRA